MSTPVIAPSLAALMALGQTPDMQSALATLGPDFAGQVQAGQDAPYGADPLASSPGTPGPALPSSGAGVGAALGVYDQPGGPTAAGFQGLDPSDVEAAGEVHDAAVLDTLKQNAALSGLEAVIRGNQDPTSAVAQYTKNQNDTAATLAKGAAARQNAAQDTEAEAQTATDPVVAARAAQLAAQKLSELRAQYVEPQQTKAGEALAAAGVTADARVTAATARAMGDVNAATAKAQTAQSNTSKLYNWIINRGTVDAKTGKARPFTPEEIGDLHTKIPGLGALGGPAAGQGSAGFAPEVEQSLTDMVQAGLATTRADAIQKAKAAGLLGGAQ